MHGKYFTFAALAVCVISSIGCEPQLETGYKPHPLNSTEADRRAYYAEPFTPESHPARDSGGPSFEGLGK